MLRGLLKGTGRKKSNYVYDCINFLATLTPWEAGGGIC